MEWIKRYGLFIGIGVFIWLIGFILLLNNGKKVDEEEVVTIASEPAIEVETPKEETKVIKMLKVDIKGSVKKPGVYEVEEGTVVNDLISLAGGLKSGATTKNINLSKKVKDEMVIYIYTSSELKKNTAATPECNCDDVVISSCEGSSIIYSEPSTNPVTSNEEVLGSTLININTAGVNELMTLSGIGEAKAKAIIDYREKNGSFKTTEDIMNVSGIGEAAYQKIKDFITV